MKLLVTGGLGFIGSNFLRMTVGDGAFSSIVNIDARRYGSNPENLRGVNTFAGYRFVEGSLANQDVVRKFIGDVDAVVNFAAETHVDRSIADPWPFIESNIIGTYNLLEAARRKDIKVFVQVSTDEVYGDMPEGRTADETDVARPSNPYSATKASADNLALAYHRTYGLNCVVTRSSNNFGPYQFPEKLIPKTIIRCLKGLKIPLYGGGRQVRSWIYVADHIEALKRIISNGKGGQIYNISAGNEVSNRELVSVILSLMGKPTGAIEDVEDRPGHDTRYSIDSSKIRRELGWKPRHEFKHALKETVDWYVDNKSWWEPLATSDALQATPWKPRWRN